MKTLIFVMPLFFIFGTASSQSVGSKDLVVEEFKVYGNCGMCKSRIEKAAKSKGVYSARWSIETKILRVEYDPLKIKSEAIHKNIANVGHDTEKVRAPDSVYEKLPTCCKYEREK